MSLSTAVHEIESHGFAARLGIANNVDMLRILAAQEPCVRELVSSLQNAGDASRLLSHASSLIREQDDVRYRNPRDTAIAIYIWALGQTQPAFAALLAAEVIRAPRLWWARKLALTLLANGAISHDIETVTERVLLKGEWQNESSTEKESLVISDPDGNLIREGRVLNVNSVDRKNDTVESTTAEVSSVTNRASQAEVVQTELVEI
jgi:hypothetical protein